MRSFTYQILALISNIAIIKFVNIKIVIFLVIFYCFAYQNNNNYILLFLALYMYSAKIDVNVITLFNYLDF